MRILPCIVISTGLLVGASAMAQQPQDQNSATSQRMDREQNHDYGWVGLIGLAGLAGLVRRNRKDTQISGRNASRAPTV